MAKQRREQTLIVKVADGTPAKEATDLLRQLLPKKAVASIEQLFPGDADPITGSIFNVTMATASPMTKLIKSLEKDEHVDYAHVPEEREPMG